MVRIHNADPRKNPGIFRNIERVLTYLPAHTMSFTDVYVQKNRILAVDGIVTVVANLSKKRLYLRSIDSCIGSREIVSFQTILTPKTMRTPETVKFLSELTQAA